MSEPINVNDSKVLSQGEVEEILVACRRGVENKNGDVDITEGIKIFYKYFNPESPRYDINKPLPGQGLWTALAFTTFFGKNEETRALLKIGANPNIDIGKKVTLLHMAATEGKSTLCLYFLKHGMNIDIQCELGRTAIMNACEANQFEVVKTLMPFKPNVMLTDNLGKTCLDYGMSSGAYKIVSYIEHYYLQHKLPIKTVSDTPKKVVKI